MSQPQACAACLRRAQLLVAVAGYIDIAHKQHRPLRDVLALGEQDLLQALAGREARELAGRLDAESLEDLIAVARRTGLQTTCRHDAAYAQRLTDDRAAPAALFVAGSRARLIELVGDAESSAPPAVAIVGARRASATALEVARRLGRGLSAAGVTVVSGLALGVDSAAHAGALEAGGRTVAVLAGGADRPYPMRKRPLYEQIVHRGAVLSEMPPGFTAFKWSFLARNRIIAGLADATIVVEAAQRSGSLVTAEMALELGREVGAVPGSALEWRTEGTNALLRDGATLVRGAQDALDLVLGADGEARQAAVQLTLGPIPPPPDLAPQLRALLSAVEEGRGTVDHLAAEGGGAAAVRVGLMELELLGLVRRGAGGMVVRATGAEERSPTIPPACPPARFPSACRSPARTPAAAPESRPT